MGPVEKTRIRSTTLPSDPSRRFTDDFDKCLDTILGDTLRTSGFDEDLACDLFAAAALPEEERDGTGNVDCHRTVRLEFAMSPASPERLHIDTTTA